MGTSTNAIMVYGYNFGASESLQLAECKESDTNPYGYFKTSWWDDEHDGAVEGEGEDRTELNVFEVMERRLYEAIPDAPAVEWSWQRDDLIKEHFGVWFEDYCSGSYPMYVLATAAFQAYRGDVVEVDVDRLRDDPAANGWDAKLAEALRILDVHPLQENPGWLLASYWSS